MAQQATLDTRQKAATLSVKHLLGQCPSVLQAISKGVVVCCSEQDRDLDLCGNDSDVKDLQDLAITSPGNVLGNPPSTHQPLLVGSSVAVTPVFRLGHGEGVELDTKQSLFFFCKSCVQGMLRIPRESRQDGYLVLLQPCYIFGNQSDRIRLPVQFPLAASDSEKF